MHSPPWQLKGELQITGLHIPESHIPASQDDLIHFGSHLPSLHTSQISGHLFVHTPFSHGKQGSVHLGLHSPSMHSSQGEHSLDTHPPSLHTSQGFAKVHLSIHRRFKTHPMHPDSSQHPVPHFLPAPPFMHFPPRHISSHSPHPSKHTFLPVRSVPQCAQLPKIGSLSTSQHIASRPVPHCMYSFLVPWCFRHIPIALDRPAPGPFGSELPSQYTTGYTASGVQLYPQAHFFAVILSQEFAHSPPGPTPSPGGVSSA